MPQRNVRLALRGSTLQERGRSPKARSVTVITAAVNISKPQIRAKAKQAAAITSGIMINARAGSATPPPAAPISPAYTTSPSPSRPTAARLLQAQQDGTEEDDLRQLATEALGEVYFRDNGRRAHGLEVKLTDLVDLRFEL
ncbi:hypothetical protein ACFWJM_15850 [Streptomyces sp. NPDC127077]|uniref:hypothetical protein n=1 Tax=Streptomyces sp. NPDC127077 TaxID=3347131 RepID=UPI00365D2314